MQVGGQLHVTRISGSDSINCQRQQGIYFINGTLQIVRLGSANRIQRLSEEPMRLLFLDDVRAPSTQHCSHVLSLSLGPSGSEADILVSVSWEKQLQWNIRTPAAVSPDDGSLQTIVFPWLCWAAGNFLYQAKKATQPEDYSQRI